MLEVCLYLWSRRFGFCLKRWYHFFIYSDFSFGKTKKVWFRICICSMAKMYLFRSSWGHIELIMHNCNMKFSFPFHFYFWCHFMVTLLYGCVFLLVVDHSACFFWIAGAILTAWLQVKIKHQSCCRNLYLSTMPPDEALSIWIKI